MGRYKKILNNLNPFYNCRRYHIPLWQCPSFLFLIMGLIIIAAIISTYFIAAARISNPQLVSLIVIGVAGLLIVIDFIITRSFERISEASRMKTEFISVVSHQLRSPLTNLKYSLEILTSGSLKKFSGKEKEYLEILKENTHRMGSLINNLLLVSRIETGELPLKKEEISLTDLVKKIILKYKAFSEASNVKIRLKAEKKLAPVSGDSLWLEQIIENLLDNSIRYIKDQGEVEIKIACQANKILFKIHDTGVGIPKDEQRYIFQKFFRSKNVLKYQTQGSGLGLYIVKKILGLMAGRIWFESSEKKGTTFYFVLPAVKHSAKAIKNKKV